MANEARRVVVAVGLLLVSMVLVVVYVPVPAAAAPDCTYDIGGRISGLDMTSSGDFIAVGRYHERLSLLNPDCTPVWTDTSANVAGGIGGSPWFKEYLTESVAISNSTPNPLRVVSGTARSGTTCSARFYDQAGLIGPQRVVDDACGSAETYAVDITPNATYAVAGADNTVAMFTGDGVPVWTYTGIVGRVISIAISNDSLFVAVGEEMNSGGLADVYLLRNLGTSASLVWHYETPFDMTLVDMTGDAGIVFAGTADQRDRADCCNAYLFYRGADGLWGTGDDQVPRWNVTQPDDVYAVATPEIRYAGYAGQTPGDTASDAYDFHSPTPPLQSWATGIAFAADASQHGPFGAFGGLDDRIYFVSISDPTPVWSYLTSGNVYAVKVSFEDPADTPPHYVVGGGEPGILYHFTQ